MHSNGKRPPGAIVNLSVLYVAGIKDTARESAVKRRSVIQMTMAKSTNGQDNDRGVWVEGGCQCCLEKLS